MGIQYARHPCSQPLLELIFISHQSEEILVILPILALVVISLHFICDSLMLSIAIKIFNFKHFCSCSVAKSCLTLCDPMNCSMPGFPVFHYLLSSLRLLSIESMMPSNHLILCHPLLLLPSIFPSIRGFSSDPVLCIKWSMYWSFSFSTGPSNVYSGLISSKYWLVWSPCSPRDFLESSPATQFKSINSSAFSLLYSPALTSIHDYWKNHSFHHTYIFQQSNASAFQYTIIVLL